MAAGEDSRRFPTRTRSRSVGTRPETQLRSPCLPPAGARPHRRRTGPPYPSPTADTTSRGRRPSPGREPPPEHDRQGQRQHRERRKIRGLHREIEGVRGHDADDRGRQSPGEWANPRRQRIAHRRQRLPEPVPGPQPPEEPPDEGREDHSPDDPGFDHERGVEGMRTPVRQSGDRLVVDGERIQPEPEEGVAVERGPDELVDLKVRGRRSRVCVQSGPYDRLEEIHAPRDDHGDRQCERAERDEYRGRDEPPPVREEQDEHADEKAEQSAPRERRQLHEQQKGEQQRQEDAVAMASLEAEVEGGQEEERDEQDDAEVVGVVRKRVRPVDVGALDGAVEVDRSRVAEQRAEDGLVEVPAALREGELSHPVEPVERDSRAERGDRDPVEVDRAARQIGDPRRRKSERDRKPGQPLRPLRHRLLALDVVEAGEVDDEERGREEEDDRDGSRNSPRPGAEALEHERGDEEDRQDSGKADRARELPLDLLEADAEERREEQDLGCSPEDHTRLLATAASSSARARRDRRSRTSVGSGVPLRRPPRWSASSCSNAARSPSTSSGATTIPAPVSRIRSAAAPSGGTAARIGRSAARYSKTFADSTPRPRPPDSGISNSSASESFWRASTSLRGRYGWSSSRSPRPSVSAHSWSAARKSPTKRRTPS